MSVRHSILTLLLTVSAGLLYLISAPAALAQVQENARNVEVVAQVGGFSNAVVVQGNYAYLGVGPSVHILDIADPARPVLVGQSPVLSSVVEELSVVGDHLYALTESSLHILDVSEAFQPEELGSFGGFARATGIAVADGFAFVADAGGYDSGGLYILDVSDPSAPRQVGSDARPSERIAVQGNYAYVASGDVLRVLDITDPSEPLWVGYHDAPGDVYEVAVAGDYVYTLRQWGLAVYDVSHPAAPVEIGFAEAFADSFALAGDYVYATRYDGVYVFDVSEPTTPTQIALWERPGAPTDLYVTTELAFVVERRVSEREYATGSLSIMDVRAPSAPVTLSTYDPPQLTAWVNIVGDYAYVSEPGHPLHILDTRDLSLPLETRHLDAVNFATELAVAGDYAYSTAGWRTLQVLDVSDPATPEVVGSFTELIVPYDVVVSGSYAYVADGGTYVDNELFGAGLRVLDVSDPTTPRNIAFAALPGHAQAIAISGNYIYINADHDYSNNSVPAGLYVFDVSDPETPRQVGFYPGFVEDIVVAGHYLYTVGGTFIIRDITDPALPRPVGEYGGPGSYESIVVGEGYAYIAARYAGLRIIKIDNPAQPSEVGHFGMVGSESFDVSLGGGYIYLAHGSSGLFVLRFAPSTNLYLPLIRK